jgi:hypothetical protein
MQSTTSRLISQRCNPIPSPSLRLRLSDLLRHDVTGQCILICRMCAMCSDLLTLTVRGGGGNLMRSWLRRYATS